MNPSHLDLSQVKRALENKSNVRLRKQARKWLRDNQLDLDRIGSLHEHLAWALDEISAGDYDRPPKHECEFKTDPGKGHCDFCWGFWAAVGAGFPDKFTTDINDD